MTRYLSSAIVIGALALPVTVLAQHTNSGGAASTGTATSSAPAPSSSSGGSSSGGGSSSSGGSSAGTFAAVPSTGSSGGHQRGTAPANGTAVPRGSVPGSSGTIVITQGSGFYPWGYGGVIGGGLYGGYYGGYYDGYYGAYDPWYGWFPAYAPVAGGDSDFTGGLKLRVKPSDASVYVDSFYVGVVDDFDGAFQKLKLDRGPHHIEIRSPQHTPLAFDVMIQEDFTITYRGELAKQ